MRERIAGIAVVVTLVALGLMLLGGCKAPQEVIVNGAMAAVSVNDAAQQLATLDGNLPAVRRAMTDMRAAKLNLAPVNAYLQHDKSILDPNVNPSLTVGG